jgi:UDPglucose--hexose-1-phosphate uridylyltransferase
MSSEIPFRIVESESTFLDPRKKFAPSTEKFQVRFDPLTNRSGHFCHFGAIKPQPLPLDAYSTPEVKGFCPFCPEFREKVTPKFVPEVLLEGRLKKNQAVLMPNLFPYDVYSGVAIMTDEHVVPLQGFTEGILSDAFAIGIEFFNEIKNVDASLPYNIMTWNYMPPSGGGLVHPHQQYFATDCPGNQFTDELTASEKFYKTHGKSYWPELIREEKRLDERYIGSIGDSAWLSSFVSLGIFGEIMCIFPEVFSVSEFTEKRIDELVAGLLKVFQYYIDTEIYSFNASLVFGPEDQRYFPCHFRLIARTFLNTRDYAPDLNFFQALLDEPICVTLPEELCRELKKYF